MSEGLYNNICLNFYHTSRIYPVFTWLKYIPVFGIFWGTVNQLYFEEYNANDIIAAIILMLLALCLVLIYY